jgi:dienelactone hydrolase
MMPTVSPLVPSGPVTRPEAQRQQASWTSAIPPLVLVGAEDVPRPAAPWKYFLGDAAARDAKIEMQIYPGAYHHFDWPNLRHHELPSLRNAAGAVPSTERILPLDRMPSLASRFSPT